MTHHITDEHIGQIAEQVGLIGPASRVGDCHAASLRFARALLTIAASQSEPVAYRIDYPGLTDTIGLRRWCGADEYASSRPTIEFLGGVFVPLYAAPAPAVPSDIMNMLLEIHRRPNNVGIWLDDLSRIVRQHREALTAAPAPVLEPAAPSDERASFEAWASKAGLNTTRDESPKYHDYHQATTRFAWEAWQARAALTAATTPPAQHPDDAAVDRFAIAMKTKLAASRAKGRGGWDDPAQCSVEHLARLLVEHVAKGDPVDVANFAMMLHQRGADHAVLAAAQQPAAPEDVARDAELLNYMEELVKRKGAHGVSFDYVRHVEDGYVVEKGFRVMWRHTLGERKPTLRAAIDAARAAEKGGA